MTNAQIVSVGFHDPAQSQIVNRLLKGMLYPGIYQGGWLAGSGTTVTVSKFVALIRDDTGADDMIRVETTAGLSGNTLTVAAATPYVVLDWTYITSPSTVSILAVATPSANQLIVGKCNFSGAIINPSNPFDYSQRIQAPDTRLNFMVQSNGDPDNMYVWVLAGSLNGVHLVPQTIQINGGASPSAGATFYVYMSAAGVVQSGAVILPGTTILASIYFATNGLTAITTSMITDLRQTIIGGGVRVLQRLRATNNVVIAMPNNLAWNGSYGGPYSGPPIITNVAPYTVVSSAVMASTHPDSLLPYYDPAYSYQVCSGYSAVGKQPLILQQVVTPRAIGSTLRIEIRVPTYTFARDNFGELVLFSGSTPVAICGYEIDLDTVEQGDNRIMAINYEVPVASLTPITFTVSANIVQPTWLNGTRGDYYKYSPNQITSEMIIQELA